MLTTSGRFDLSEDFQVVVGAEIQAESKAYMMHKHVLAKSCDFFRKACAKNGKRAR